MRPRFIRPEPASGVASHDYLIVVNNDGVRTSTSCDVGKKRAACSIVRFMRPRFIRPESASGVASHDYLIVVNNDGVCTSTSRDVGKKRAACSIVRFMRPRFIRPESASGVASHDYLIVVNNDGVCTSTSRDVGKKRAACSIVRFMRPRFIRPESASGVASYDDGAGTAWVGFEREDRLSHPSDQKQGRAGRPIFGSFERARICNSLAGWLVTVENDQAQRRVANLAGPDLPELMAMWLPIWPIIWT